MEKGKFTLWNTTKCVLFPTFISTVNLLLQGLASMLSSTVENDFSIATGVWYLDVLFKSLVVLIVFGILVAYTIMFNVIKMGIKHLAQGYKFPEILCWWALIVNYTYLIVFGVNTAYKF